MKNNVNFLYEKLWQDVLSEIVPETVAKEIATELLIPDRIDSFAFADNYEKFLRRGMPSVREAFLPNRLKEYSTSSIKEASNPLKYILSFPDWFIAAYPDVFLWFGNVQEEHMRNRKENENWYEAMEALVCNLFRINPKDKGIQTGDIYDSNEKWLPKWLKNLVSSYKQETGKKPETSVDETKNNTLGEIYKYAELAMVIYAGGLDSLTLIARKTTMYYLELLNNYKERFKSEASLLAAAGVLDAQVYIFTCNQIEASEIVELAEKVVIEENNHLTEFIVRLMIKMLALDTPEVTQEMVESVCQEEKPRISEEIQRVRKEYKRDSFIAMDAQAFMESPNFSEIRSQLSIDT